MNDLTATLLTLFFWLVIVPGGLYFGWRVIRGGWSNGKN